MALYYFINVSYKIISQIRPTYEFYINCTVRNERKDQKHRISFV